MNSTGRLLWDIDGSRSDRWPAALAEAWEAMDAHSSFPALAVAMIAAMEEPEAPVLPCDGGSYVSVRWYACFTQAIILAEQMEAWADRWEPKEVSHA